MHAALRCLARSDMPGTCGSHGEDRPRYFEPSPAVNRCSMSSAGKSAVIGFPESRSLFGSAPVLAGGRPFAL